MTVLNCHTNVNSHMTSFGNDDQKPVISGPLGTFREAGNLREAGKPGARSSGSAGSRAEHFHHF